MNEPSQWKKLKDEHGTPVHPLFDVDVLVGKWQGSQGWKTSVVASMPRNWTTYNDDYTHFKEINPPRKTTEDR